MMFSMSSGVAYGFLGCMPRTTGLSSFEHAANITANSSIGNKLYLFIISTFPLFCCKGTIKRAEIQNNFEISRT